MKLLISAIMPTRGRAVMAATAINTFLQQTYSKKQLVILDDADDPSFLDPPEFKTVTYMRVDGRLLIAEKRNVCCQYAAGEIICHFDDDDWSSPHRMTAQFDFLKTSQASVVGFHSMLFYELMTGRAAKFTGHNTYGLGTSLMYTRDYWKRHPFRPGPEDPNVAEDNQFVREAVSAGEFKGVDARDMMVATVHQLNTSPKDISKNGFSFVPQTAIPKGFFS